MDDVLFGKPEGGDEGEGDKDGGYYKTILQGKMFGEWGGIFFGEVVGIDELVKDAEHGDPDGAAQLLQEAVEGSSGGGLVAGNGVEEGGGDGSDEEAYAEAADDHGQQDEENGGADVNPRE